MRGGKRSSTRRYVRNDRRGEMAALWDHRRGRDVRELMALLDRAARAKGERREAAIAMLQEFENVNATATG